MVILGIDPGFRFSGFGVIKKEMRTACLLDHGYLSLSSSTSIACRIHGFYTFYHEKIEQWQVTHLALETPFLGKNAQNFLKLGYLRGILYLLAQQHEILISEFSPREIKQSLTGFGGASKDQVARVILQLFPKLPQPKKEDVTDAIAISLCRVWKQSQKMSI